MRKMKEMPTTMTTMKMMWGRYLQEEMSVECPMAKMTMNMVGYIGYDNAIDAYYASWMDINFTGMLLLHGEYDASASTYRFSGEMPDNEGRPIPTREELKVQDTNHLLARYYETRGGRETLVVELEYSRP